MVGSAERIDPAASVLLLVDHQQRLMPAMHDGARVGAQALRLAEAAQRLGIPVLGTEQNPTRLGPIEPALRAHCRAVVAKMEFDACDGGLLDALAAIGSPRHVVVGGCEAHVCVLQTALGLLRAGHAVWVVADACGSRFPADHALGLERLRQAGAVIVSPEMVLFEWLGSCRHPQFGAVLELVKRGAPG